MRAELYDGLSGVTLFSAYLGDALADDGLQDLARRSLATTRSVFDYLDRGWTLGAFSGLAGFVYLLTHLSYLWQDESLLDEAAHYANELQPLIGSDDKYDVVAKLLERFRFCSLLMPSYRPQTH